MSKSARIAFLLALAAFPLLEIGLLIRTGQAIGFWQLALWVIVTAILGTIVIRRVGLAFASRALAGLSQGGDRIRPLLSGGLLVMAGMLLIFPGLICDALGIFLLIPVVRNAIITSGVIRFLNSVTVYRGDFADAQTYQTRDRGFQGHAPNDIDIDGGKTIEGEFERIDEQDVPKSGKTPGQALRR